MVQALGRRERNRAARTSHFLAAARHVVFTEGLDALTMQRLAAEVDCAVGTAYTYFPSKSALVAEVQREAIATLTASAHRFLDRLDREAQRSLDDPAVRALATLVGFGRFWVDCFDTYPEEARLLQVLMSETSPTVSDDDVNRVAPAAFELLGMTRVAFDDAVASGALSPAPAMERTVVMAAAINGVLLLAHVARVDPDLFDGPRLAGGLVHDLLAGWGADPDRLAAAQHAIDELATKGPLAA